jgi:hypothetical protein
LIVGSSQIDSRPKAGNRPFTTRRSPPKRHSYVPNLVHRQTNDASKIGSMLSLGIDQSHQNHPNVAMLITRILYIPAGPIQSNRRQESLSSEEAFTRSILPSGTPTSHRRHSLGERSRSICRSVVYSSSTSQPNRYGTADQDYPAFPPTSTAFQSRTVEFYFPIHCNLVKERKRRGRVTEVPPKQPIKKRNEFHRLSIGFRMTVRRCVFLTKKHVTVIYSYAQIFRLELFIK